MKVLRVRNTHEGLAQGVHYLSMEGVKRDSRNGPVIVSPEPVSTVFERPDETVIFWPQRNPNIAFLVYEILWMLHGRQDSEGVARYVKRMKEYGEEDGTMHGAYGFRWRYHFEKDQLPIIADRLRRNREDRRVVLGMWDPVTDLVPLNEYQPKDLPCNMIVTFQIDHNERLNIVVFNRSNDIVWGTYFANAFQFGTLLQFMAGWCKCLPGTYTQVSVNFHGYLDTLEPLVGKMGVGIPNPYTAKVEHLDNRYMYVDQSLRVCMDHRPELTRDKIKMLLLDADSEVLNEAFPTWEIIGIHDEWYEFAFYVLAAHELHRMRKTAHALELLDEKIKTRSATHVHHWLLAMHHWLRRRMEN